MTGSAARYRFANEKPGWNHLHLIHDEEPAMQGQRWRSQQEREWSFEWYPRESEAMGLHASNQKTVYPRFYELMKIPRSKRHKAVRGDRYAYWGHPYRDPDLAELLLVESERSLHHGDPACADEAETAEWIVDTLYSEPKAPGFRAFARTLQAAARHFLGDTARGEELFRSALDALGRCEEPMPWAWFCRALSRVREQQNRLAEAAVWLARARELYRAAEYAGRKPEQWCLRRLARIHLRMNEPARALAVLAQADTGEHPLPEIEAEILLGQAACLAAFGLRWPARARLHASRNRRRWIWYSWHRLPLEWWDARITLRLGDLEDAVPRFDAVRRHHLEVHNFAEAGLASIELLLAYEQAGAWTRETRPDVFGELARSFDRDRGNRRFLPFAEDRAALESVLRDGTKRLGREGIPEARACEAFLEQVQALPQPPSRFEVLYTKAGRRRKIGSTSKGLSKRELVRMFAQSAHFGRVRFLDECRDD